MMEQVRIGLIGLGTMGMGHAKSLIEHKVPGGKLTAVCDRSPQRRQWAQETLGGEIQVFDQVEALLDSGLVDGVLIATPHYTHPELAIQALEKVASD